MTIAYSRVPNSKNESLKNELFRINSYSEVDVQCFQNFESPWKSTQFCSYIMEKVTINVMSSGKYFKLFSFMFIVPSEKVKYKRFDSLKK